VILAPTPTGRRRFRSWVTSPVAHLRDLRAELLLKLVFAERLAIDISTMLDRQRVIVDDLAVAMASAPPDDVVSLWRLESAHAAQRFLARL
jgi:ribonuclease D